LRLTTLPGELAICRLPATAAVPDWARGAFVSITHTVDELSIVCERAAIVESDLPDGSLVEGGWWALKVAGPLDLDLTGILASLATPLAEAEISIFAISTYDTDYVLVRAEELGRATAVVRGAGHEVV